MRTHMRIQMRIYSHALSLAGTEAASTCCDGRIVSTLEGGYVAFEERGGMSERGVSEGELSACGGIPPHDTGGAAYDRSSLVSSTLHFLRGLRGC
jgi:hypothetical protein